MRFRPQIFTLNPHHHLAHGLVFFGGGAHAGSTLLYDSSAYGNHGSLIATEPTDWNPYNGRWRLTLDGSAEYGIADKVAAITSGTPHTVAIWCHTTSTAAVAAAAFHSSGANRLILFKNYSVTNKYAIYSELGGGTIFSVSDATHASEVNHIGWTYDGTNANLFVDGVVQSSPIASGAGTWNQFSIGQEWDGGSASNFWPGSLWDCMVWNRVLIDTEWKMLANPSDPMLGGLIEPVTPRTYWFVGGGTPATTRRKHPFYGPFAGSLGGSL
jgi:hypothetical protein